MPQPEQVNEPKMLIELHSRNYQERFNEPYLVVWGRDMKHSVALLKKFVYAKLAQLNREFFESEDKQIADGGRTFPQFAYHLPRLIAASSGDSSRTVKMLKGIFYDGQRSPIRDALALLSVTFRSDMEAPQTRSYERALVDVKDQPEILQKAAELLIDEAANGRQFYPVPKPADVKGACAKVIEVMRLQAFAEATKHCDHPRNMEEISREDGTTEFKKCSCYVRGKVAMDAIARPLALPAYDADQERETA